MNMTAPVAKKNPYQHKIHGHIRQDPYYWMKDRENPEVISYLEAENTYTKGQLAHTEDFQKQIFEEIKNRIKEEDQSVPYWWRGFYYYYRFESGKEYPIYARKAASLEAEEEITLDVNVLAEGQSYCQSTGPSISPNQELIAFGLDLVGRRIYELRFLNLKTGEYFPERIAEVTGNIVWAEDNKTLFYSKQDPKTLRSHQIFRHVLGTDPSEDVLIFEEKDETFNTYVTKTRSREYLLIISSSTLSDEAQYLASDQPEGDWTVFHPRERDHEYGIDHFNGNFYVLTNWEAQNFQLMQCPSIAGKTDKSHWKTLIAHRKDTLLEDFQLFSKQLVLEEREKGLNQIRVMEWESKEAWYIEYRDPAYSASLGHNPDVDSPSLRYSYESLTTPRSTYEIHFETKEQTLLKQQAVLGGFAVENYQSERIFATAKDGSQVPMSIVYRKGARDNGSTAPLLLYAYGSYGYSLDPYFSLARLSLLDRGFIFVIAHIRGGEEMGRYWYDDGKLLKKKNTFTDFIACAEHLLAFGYTERSKLFISGGSAGGLLVGAVINMRPELFYGAMAAVPFVDVVSTMLDEDIPLTTGEFDEWGNPKDKTYYDYMLSYSPYDNVEAQAYPHLLVTSGLHDSQVQYWEPTKWVAKLRDIKTGDQKLLLHTNMEAGHSGASGRYQPYIEVAMEYAFLLDLAGIKK
ncbi:MAG: S9 family peptidase [Bacteroidia bacterium]